MSYLVDTYALMEWFVQDNQNYKKYFQEIEETLGYTTQFVLLEFYYWSYHEFGEKEADERYGEVNARLQLVPIDDELIKAAGKFRSDMLRKKKKFSYADSIGYTAAKRAKSKFLTGDEEFRGMEGVEFVK